MWTCHFRADHDIGQMAPTTRGLKFLSWHQPGAATLRRRASSRSDAPGVIETDRPQRLSEVLGRPSCSARPHRQDRPRHHRNHPIYRGPGSCEQRRRPVPGPGNPGDGRLRVLQDFRDPSRSLRVLKERKLGIGHDPGRLVCRPGSVEVLQPRRGVTGSSDARQATFAPSTRSIG